MAGTSRVNLASLTVVVASVVGLILSTLVFALWLSDPTDMLKGNNPLTMTIYALIALGSGGALLFGLRRLRK